MRSKSRSWPTPAQRTFTFSSPASAGVVTIDGQEFHVAAGESLQSLVSTINASSTATVYAAALGVERSCSRRARPGRANRDTSKSPARKARSSNRRRSPKKGAMRSTASTAAPSATSSSNTLTEAIPGVTLSLKSLTTTTGPVTVEVQPPAANTGAIVAQVQSFIKLYNSTISSIQHQLSTKPSTHPETPGGIRDGNALRRHRTARAAERNAREQLHSARPACRAKCRAWRTSA